MTRTQYEFGSGNINSLLILVEGEHATQEAHTSAVSPAGAVAGGCCASRVPEPCSPLAGSPSAPPSSAAPPTGASSATSAAPLLTASGASVGASSRGGVCAGPWRGMGVNGDSSTSPVLLWAAGSNGSAARLADCTASCPKCPRLSTAADVSRAASARGTAGQSRVRSRK